MSKKWVYMRLFEPLRKLFSRISERDTIFILSLFVGIACGLAAVALKLSIDAIHKSLTFWFDGESYNYLYLIYPGVGMLLALLFVTYIVKDNIISLLSGLLQCFFNALAGKCSLLRKGSVAG